MSKMSEIRSVRELQAQRNALKKRADRQEKAVMQDLQGIADEVHAVASRLNRVRCAVDTLVQKMEFATLLWPVLKRLFRKKS